VTCATCKYPRRLNIHISAINVQIDDGVCVKWQIQSLKSVIVTMKSDYEHMTSPAETFPPSSSSLAQSSAADASIRHLLNCKVQYILLIVFFSNTFFWIFWFTGFLYFNFFSLYFFHIILRHIFSRLHTAYILIFHQFLHILASTSALVYDL